MLRCPICNAELVVRNGKFGEFFGCRRYPKCTFTTDLEESKQYDDGNTMKFNDMTLEEQGEAMRQTLLNDGYYWEDALYAKERWIKED